MGNLGYGAFATHPGEVLKDEIEERDCVGERGAGVGDV